jgi:hypothetical protein
MHEVQSRTEGEARTLVQQMWAGISLLVLQYASGTISVDIERRDGRDATNGRCTATRLQAPQLSIGAVGIAAETGQGRLQGLVFGVVGGADDN